MNHLWPILIAGFCALVGSRFFLKESKSAGGEFDRTTSQVTVRRRIATVYLSIVIAVAPWPLVVKVACDTTASTATILLGMGLFSSASGFGLGLLAYCLRKIIVSREGIRLTGIGARAYSWDDVRDIEATVNGGIGVLRFALDGRRLVVDSTFDGFRQLVRALEVWPTGNAKPIAERAAKALANWRDDPKPKA